MKRLVPGTLSETRHVSLSQLMMKPITVPEACTFLKMEKSTLYKLMKARAFPFYRRPGSRVVLFDQDELESWLQNGRVPAADEGKHAFQHEQENHSADEPLVLENVQRKVYHRNPCYR
jgi:excisionase family DNA binding protein